MAGMAYLLPPPDGWYYLRARIANAFDDACCQMDGWMGILWPGFDEYWVDYEG